MKKFLLTQSGLIALFLLLVLTSNAQQWISNGPYGGTGNSVEIIGSDVFAGGKGIFKSTDNGITWQDLSPANKILAISDIAAYGGTIYAGTGNNQGVYVSTDGGSTWTQKNNGLTSYMILTMYANSDGAYAETHNGTFFSSDGGNTWASRKTGLPIQGVLTFTEMGDTLFAGSYGAGLYLSTNAGVSWTKHAGFPASAYVHGMATEGNTIYATTETGLYRSDDRGQTWMQTNTVLWNYASLAVKPGYLFAGMEDEGIYVSTDKGVTFTKQSNGFEGYGIGTYPRVPDFAITGNGVIAATYDGMYRSTDNGMNWMYSNKGIVGPVIQDIAARGSNVFAGGDRMYASSDKGMSWMRSNNGLSTGSILQVVIHGSSVFLSTGGKKVYRSDDNGSTWIEKNTGITNYVDLMAADDKRILAVVRGGQNFNPKLMQSTNNGETWTELVGALAISGGMTALAVKGKYIYVGTAQGMLLRSDDNGDSWLDIGSYLPTVKISAILPADEATYVGTSGKGVFRFTNNDHAMESFNKGLTFYDITDIVLQDGFLFASTMGAGIFASEVSDDKWFAADDGLRTPYVYALTSESNIVYAATSAGVYQTANGAFDAFKTLAGIPVTRSADLSTKFFPNPASGTLKYAVDTGYNVDLFTMNGSLVDSYTLPKGEGSLDISSLETGIYFLKITADDRIMYRKLVVE